MRAPQPVVRSRTSKGRSRRFALLLLAGCLLAVNSVVWVHRVVSEQEAQQADGPPPAIPVPSPAVTQPQRPAPPSSVVPPAARRRPIDVPNHPYAPEVVRQIGTIEIPKIGLVHPVFEGITMHNIDRGPSHWPGTALPGEVGNTVFAAHRVTHSRPFRNIDQLASGDPVVFTIGGVRSIYRVTEHQVVTPTDTWIVHPTSTATGTLFACHPPGSARYRYVVRLVLAA